MHKLYFSTIILTLFSLFSQIPGIDDAIRNYDQSNQRTWGDINRMQGIIEKQNQIRKQNAQINTIKVKDYYYSFNEYPSSISDGWHDVMALNNNDFCDQRKVYVFNNKVSRYINGQGDNVNLSSNSKIIDGKVNVRLLDSTGRVFDFIEIYFFDSIEKKANR